jgi:hypothetical protein
MVNGERGGITVVSMLGWWLRLKCEESVHICNLKGTLAAIQIYFVGWGAGMSRLYSKYSGGKDQEDLGSNQDVEKLF